jgi:hypothetical protein
MEKLILNCLPITTVNWSSPAMSILKAFMEQHGYHTKVHYWNISFEFLYMNFLKNIRKTITKSWQKLL